MLYKNWQNLFRLQSCSNQIGGVDKFLGIKSSGFDGVCIEDGTAPNVIGIAVRSHKKQVTIYQSESFKIRI